jgi:hypothetical protein
MHKLCTSIKVRFLLFAALSLLAAFVGCTEESKQSLQSGTFTSDWPGASARGKGTYAPAAAEDNAGGATLNGDLEDSVTGSTEAARAITEADIIQVQGDRLYTLSRYGGLSVIDISQRDRLQLLGRYQDTHDAEPFEMYLREGVALVMFSGWGQYVETEDEKGWTWVQTSKLVALDTSNPAKISRLSGFNIPGAISDSRIVGDVLYVVSYQDGYCWDCEQNMPLTSVVSLNVSNPRAIAKIDQLTYTDDNNEWGWNRRSVTVTTDRMYVAGPEYGANGPVGSTIQVIDISDPTGDMVEAAQVQAAGEISSRWQMDEYQGVLRVISQRSNWNLDRPPVVQTFNVVSSQEITRLGRTELAIPENEQLQSARFDGPRAYAITFEQTDPLFTIDLSEPSNPRQAGELHMPGWVYHMEPRGDRLFGLGFDQDSDEGAITVSLFDVSELDQPTMLSRVNFGGDRGYLPEDQDRIHKAFRLFDELGMLLVPFSGWSYDDNDYCGRSHTGVQLVDFTRDSLTLQGAASSRGEARRGFVHDTRLFTVSDENVAVFDIDDRSSPSLTTELVLARNITRMAKLDNGAVARLTIDWWTDAISVDFVYEDSVSSPQTGMAELVLNGDDSDSGSKCDSYIYVRSTFTDGDNLLLLYDRYDETKGGSYEGLSIIDGSDPASPSIPSTTEWSLGEDWWLDDGYYSYGLQSGGASAALAGDALALMEASWEDRRDDGFYHRRLRVIDISDKRDPQYELLDLPEAESYGGLIASGEIVATSHYEAVEKNPGAVRFFLDRYDLSDPSSPRLLEPVNVPGALLHYDHGAGRAVTAELRRVEAPDEVTYEKCSERFATFDFEDDNWDTPDGVCTGYYQVLHLVGLQGKGAILLDSHRLAEDESATSWSLGDGMMFATLGRSYWGMGMIMMDCFGPSCGYYGSSEPSELLVLGGLDGETFEVGRIEIENTDQWWGWWGSPPVYAAGRKALVVGNSELAIVDASDPGKPVVQSVEPISGYVDHVEVDGDIALLSLGMYGAQMVDLAP